MIMSKKTIIRKNEQMKLLRDYIQEEIGKVLDNSVASLLDFVLVKDERFIKTL